MKLLLAIALMFLLSSCTLVSRKEIREKKPEKASGGFSIPIGSEVEVDTSALEEAEAAPPVERERPRVAVVLGPGGFKTFAYASFIKSLQKSGVPTDKVVGVGWGSLVAGIWALNARPHEAEWKVYKLDEKTFSSGSFFQSGKGSIPSTQLRPYLKENLTSSDIRRLKMKFSCPSLSLKSGTVQHASQGSLAVAVENCLVAPPQISPQNVSRSRVAALFTLKDIAKKLKREGYGVILLVNVMGDEDFLPKEKDAWATRAYWLEVRRSLWAAKNEYTDVADIKTTGTQLFDFRAKKAHSNNASALGKRIGQELVQKYKF